ncbi:RNA polymerase sigma factor [Streptomyces sp. NPDC054840]
MRLFRPKGKPMPEADIEKLLNELWGDPRFIESLTRAARSVLDRDDVLVDDMVQLAGAKLVLELRDGVTLENPRSWLRRVVVNNSLGAIRDRKARPTVPLENLKQHEAGPEAIVAMREILIVIADHLPERQRLCISLHIVGFTDAEIADTLEIRTESVVRNIERARAKIRQFQAAPELFPLNAWLEGGKA